MLCSYICVDEKLQNTRRLMTARDNLNEHMGILMFLFLLWRVSACLFFCAALRSTDGAARKAELVNKCLCAWVEWEKRETLLAALWWIVRTSLPSASTTSYLLPLPSPPPSIHRTGDTDGGVGVTRGEWELASPHSPHGCEGCQWMHWQGLRRLGKAANSRCPIKADRILCLPFASQSEKSCTWGSLPVVGESRGLSHSYSFTKSGVWYTIY